MKKFITSLAVVAGLAVSSTASADTFVSQYCDAYAEMGKSVIIARQAGVSRADTQEFLEEHAENTGRSEVSIQLAKAIGGDLVDRIYRMDHSVINSVSLDTAVSGMRAVCLLENS